MQSEARSLLPGDLSESVDVGGREVGVLPTLGGGFKYFLCSSLFGEDFQFD